MDDVFFRYLVLDAPEHMVQFPGFLKGLSPSPIENMDIKDAVQFSGGPKGVTMNSIFLKPVPITKDNLDVVIDAGWVSKETVCQGVKPGTVAVCG